MVFWGAECVVLAVEFRVFVVCGCEIVSWYKDGKFYQSTSFNYDDSFEMEDFEQFNKIEWVHMKDTYEETYKFHMVLGCRCSETTEKITFEFNWNTNKEDKDKIIKERHDEWVFENVDSNYSLVDEGVLK